MIAFLILGGLVGTSACRAARMPDERRLPPEAIARMPPLRAVMFPLDARRSVFWFEPAMGGQQDMVGSAVTQSIVNGPGTFAYGAAAGAVGLLFAASERQGTELRIAREVEDYFATMGDAGSFDAERDAWQAALAQAIAAHAPIEGAVLSLSAPEGKAPKGGRCPHPDHCLEIEPTWGYSSDGAHLDFMLALRVWSPALRKPGAAPRREPDYANLLLFRSDAPALAEAKSAADRAALEAAARDAYVRRGIPALVARTKAKRPSEASAARKQVVPLLERHRERMKEARASGWTPAARRFRYAQLWSAQGIDGVRSAFGAAAEAMPRMIALEFSSAGQARKCADCRFRQRDRDAVAVEVQPGARHLAYLNSGALVSKPASAAGMSPWHLRVPDPGAGEQPSAAD